MLLRAVVLHGLIRGGGALVRLLLGPRLGLRWRLGIESMRCSHSGMLAGVEGTAAMYLIDALANRIPRARSRK